MKPSIALDAGAHSRARSALEARRARLACASTRGASLRRTRAALAQSAHLRFVCASNRVSICARWALPTVTRTVHVEIGLECAEAAGNARTGFTSAVIALITRLALVGARKRTLIAIFPT